MSSLGYKTILIKQAVKQFQLNLKMAKHRNRLPEKNMA